MDIFSDEILLLIFEELDFPSVLKMRLMCTRFNKCLFSAISFSNIIISLWDAKKGYNSKYLETRKRKLFEIAKKIPNFDFTIGHNSLLKFALEYGYLDIVKFLIERDININFTFENHETPICYAIEHGYIDIVKYLVKRGANIHFDDDLPLYNATVNNYSDIVKYLTKRGAHENIWGLSRIIQTTNFLHLQPIKYPKIRSYDIPDWDITMFSHYIRNISNPNNID
jgi:hypothetical protein